MRLREAAQLAQDHTAHPWQSQDLLCLEGQSNITNIQWGKQMSPQRVGKATCLRNLNTAEEGPLRGTEAAGP